MQAQVQALQSQLQLLIAQYTEQYHTAQKQLTLTAETVLLEVKKKKDRLDKQSEGIGEVFLKQGSGKEVSSFIQVSNNTHIVLCYTIIYIIM